MIDEAIQFFKDNWWWILLGSALINYFSEEIKKKQNSSNEVRTISPHKNGAIHKNTSYTYSAVKDHSGFHNQVLPSANYAPRENISYLVNQIREYLANQGWLEDEQEGDYYFKESIWKSDISIYLTNPKKFAGTIYHILYQHICNAIGDDWFLKKMICLYDFDQSYMDRKFFLENEKTGEIISFSIVGEGLLEKFSEQYPTRWALLKNMKM